MQNQIFSRSIVIAASVVSFGAFAHGVQKQISFNSTTGKIETRAITHSNGTTSPVPGFSRGDTLADITRVYTMAVLPSVIGGQTYWYSRPTDVRNTITNLPSYPSGPGISFRYNYQSGGAGFGWEWGNAASPASNPNLPNLSGSSFGYQILDGLKKWDGASFVDAGVTQLQLFAGDGTSIPASLNQATTTDAGPFGSINLSAVSSNTKPGATSASVPHSSMTYRLLGDGVSPTAQADDGIYLLSLKLTSTAVNPLNPSVPIESDPFYFVLSKGESVGDAIAASNFIASSRGIGASQVQILVPEPAGVSLLALAQALLGRRRSK